MSTRVRNSLKVWSTCGGYFFFHPGTIDGSNDLRHLQPASASLAELRGRAEARRALGAQPARRGRAAHALWRRRREQRGWRRRRRHGQHDGDHQEGAGGGSEGQGAAGGAGQHGDRGDRRRRRRDGCHLRCPGATRSSRAQHCHLPAPRLRAASVPAAGAAPIAAALSSRCPWMSR